MDQGLIVAISLILLFLLIHIILSRFEKSRTKSRQKGAGFASASLMLAANSFNVTNGQGNGGIEVSHHCDPGSPVGSFDSGCSSHH
jgi:multisubunit Na+/H+ antiporter MnhB subunit